MMDEYSAYLKFISKVTYLQLLQCLIHSNIIVSIRSSSNKSQDR